ncbi:hypothetical protein [Actinoplanes sp. TFC3]|uniref:hypothetical protein n=1 Tax=Actinoplanes sp. TFC3 TaxID=1710355 RepID=UPI000835A6C3|nr:hypothetical protein [Actinoplanes sp. TFC3]
MRGGLIILGLDEREGFAATGLPDAAKTASDHASLCLNEMEPPLRPHIRFLRSKVFRFSLLSSYEVQMLLASRGQSLDDIDPVNGVAFEALNFRLVTQQ